MAEESRFHVWIQKQHGIGSFLLPIIALLLLAIVMVNRRAQQATNPPEEFSFQDYPYDAGLSSADSKPSEPKAVFIPPESQAPREPLNGERRALAGEPEPTRPLDAERPAREPQRGAPGEDFQ